MLVKVPQCEYLKVLKYLIGSDWRERSLGIPAQIAAPVTWTKINKAPDIKWASDIKSQPLAINVLRWVKITNK